MFIDIKSEAVMQNEKECPECKGKMILMPG
jgi:ribosomal protein S27AE